MKKKVASLLLCAALIAGLAACGDSGATSTDTAEGGSTPSSTAGSNAAASDSTLLPTPAGEFPIVPEGAEVTLTVAVQQDQLIADYYTNFYVNWLQDYTGVTLEFIEYPSDTREEKMLLELSSGDPSSLPDIYMLPNMINVFGPSYAPRWYHEGMIIPLNDLIEEYGYHYQERLARTLEYGNTVEDWITSADGNIYFMPGFTATPQNTTPYRLFMKQEWLDAVGKEMPTTTEEFREVLRAFKNDDPNGNGQQDEIPFSGMANPFRTYYGYDTIINSFIYNHVEVSRMYVEDGAVLFAPTTDEWRQAMIYLRELCDEGLYYEGSFTQDQNTLSQIALNENDILGTFECIGVDMVLMTGGEEEMTRWEPVPVLTGPNGANYMTYVTPAPTPNGIITTGCQYPEIAFRLLDAMMDPMSYLIKRYAEPGVNWDWADEGATTFYGTPAVIKILDNVWTVPGQNAHFLNQGPFIQDPEVSSGLQPQEGFDYNEINIASYRLQQETGRLPDEILANLVYSEEELDVVATAKLDVDNYVLQTVASFTAGDWDPTDDARWESYVAEYEKMGLAEYQAIVQAAYNRQKGV